jgi:VWFA-related protein
MKKGTDIPVGRRAFLQSFVIPPLAMLLGGAGEAGVAQVTGRPFTITSTVERVVLDVSVKDSKGGYVTGLAKNNFRVFEDGRLQPILHFDRVDTPLNLGLIVDISGSMREKRPAVIMAGLAFAKESNPKDEFFVVNFNERVKPGLPSGTDFSDDLQTLKAALYMGRAVGKTAMYDAVIFGIRHLNKGTQPKKTLIVVSDGGDNTSKASQAEMMRLIKASEVTIYCVGLFTDDDEDRNPDILRKMSKLSGGEYFNPQVLDQVIPVFQKIAKDIRHRYTISYEPDPTLDPVKCPDRSIRVVAHSLGHKKLIVRTRTSYSLRPAPGLVAETSG